MNFISRYAGLVLVMEAADFESGKQGKRIQFIDGKYSTEDKEEIRFIKKHPDFGVFIFAEEEPKLESSGEK